MITKSGSQIGRSNLILKLENDYVPLLPITLNLKIFAKSHTWRPTEMLPNAANNLKAKSLSLVGSYSIESRSGTNLITDTQISSSSTRNFDSGSSKKFMNVGTPKLLLPTCSTRNTSYSRCHQITFFSKSS